ncbi:MAG: glycosyltransferase family 39 protein [Anaerolineae bacterium]|nr:glycosyltransferase family 39 protein [Anaerolineae bacterium]
MLRLLLIFSALAICFAITTPIFEKPDEETHFAYVRHVAQMGELPTLNGGESNPWKQEGGQPPLYYWLAASVAGRFDLSNFERQLEPNANPINDPYAPNNKNKLIITPEKRFPNHSGATLAAFCLRLFGLLPSWLSIYSSYRLARLFAEQARAQGWRLPDQLPIVAASLVAFNPMFAFINTSVSNDGLVIALSSLGLWLMGRCLTRWLWRDVILLGAVVGLASITKLSGVMLLPFAALAVLISVLRWRRATWPQTALKAAFMLGLPWLVIAGWWYVRNVVLYGDPTSTTAFAHVAGVRQISPGEALGEWQGFRWSYIALFGQVNIPAPSLTYPVFDLWLLVCALGLGWGLWQWRGAKWGWPTTPVVMLGLFGLHIVVVLLGILRWTMMTPASQGRLLFPAIASVSLLLALGWGAVCQSLRLRLALFVPSAVQLGLGVWMALWPIPTTYTPVLALGQPRQPCPELRFEPLLSLSCPTFTRPAPDRVQVHASAQAKATTGTNYLLTAKLSSGEQALGQITTYTGGGLLPSTQWRVGDRWSEVIEFRVPPTLTLPLQVAFSLNDQERSSLPIFHDAASLVAAEPIGKLEFGELFVRATPFQRGQPLHVTLTWRATAQPNKDYNVFMQLLDANGKIVAQRDGPPANGFLPTSRWLPPLVFDDVRTLNIPADLPAGEYRLVLGMYDLQSGARIGIQNSLGVWSPDAALLVMTFR